MFRFNDWLEEEAEHFSVSPSGQGGTSAFEQNTLEVGAEHGVEEGALWSEEGAGEALFVKRIHGGDPGGQRKTKQKRL